MSLTLAQADPEVAAALAHETLRQHEGLEMIASENFVSEAVLEAAGSIFTNKYAEGYPGRRYYGGCEFTDVVENLARDRAKQIFGAEHANVQPHSGSQANASAYMAVLQTGDTILGLDLCPRRPPDPRAQAELQRQALPAHVLHGPARHGDDRLRRAGVYRRARAAQGHHRRRQRLSETLGFRAHAPDRRQGGRGVYLRHGAHRRPGGGRRASLASAPCAHHHHHHAQDAARAARGTDSLRAGAGRGGGQGGLPRPAGRSAGAYRGRQGCSAGRSAAARVQDLLRADCGQRAGAGGGARKRPASASSPAAQTTI